MDMRVMVVLVYLEVGCAYLVDISVVYMYGYRIPFCIRIRSFCWGFLSLLPYYMYVPYSDDRSWPEESVKRKLSEDTLILRKVKWTLPVGIVRKTPQPILQIITS